ncbi:disease resistance protein Roq1-like [Lycium barbarum]|uniref:disease resistance protein Roq1-like n=1 Tax=Lycium barbarum TaxID=112863 RepID=UPI00293EFE6E|nr:disease resistance protein Roq1-like [Lycium barbarum]
MDSRFTQGQSSTSSNILSTQGESSASFKFFYDVFLSFRGIDTRKTFSGHLYDRLRLHGYQIFKDDKSLRKGDVISPALEEGIEKSRISIVVLSTSYASSRWCLDELVKILECKEKLNQRVMPIFYDVEPTEVRKQTGKFGTEFAKLKKKCETQRMKKWKAALTEVANLSGSELRVLANGDESEFIKIIMQDVKKEVNSIPLNVASYPVGVDSRAKDIIESLLQNGCEYEVSMVGIHGVGGIGKTTLAKKMYNQSFQHGHFDGSCFLSDVKSQDKNIGLHKLQEKLLNILLKSKDSVNCVDEGIKLMETRLRSKKVLIVLDDVDTEKQLKSLTKRSWFGSGSLIIITTRNKRVLRNLRRKERYEAKLLNDDEARLLFCEHAFDNPSLPQDYVNLAQDIIKYAGGLPLALVTLGSHLHGQSIEEWNEEFKRLKDIPHEDIQKILKISFDGLPHDTKTVFLDIACPFQYLKEKEVTKILNACGFHAKSEIATLVQKHLLQREGHCLVMHDLVRDMGREIVRLEATQCPGGRSRLFIHKEVSAVLLGNTGTEKVEVLIWDTDRVGALEGLTVSTEVFQKMKNLRVLIIDGLCVSGDFGLFPKQLKYLSWRFCPLERMPSNFPAANLVFLDMKGGYMEEFDLNLQCCPMLKELNLSFCERLGRTPKFNGAQSLETLLLQGCRRLREIDQSICQLKSLQVLDISGCDEIQTLPVDLGNVQSLRCLCVIDTGIKRLPKSVEKLKNLVSLELGFLKGGRIFPQSRPLRSLSTCLSHLALTNFGFSEADIHVHIGSLSSLICLDLSGNNFHHLPFDFSKLRFLKDLRLNDCKNLQTLPSVSNLENLESLQLRNCKKLVDIRGLDNLPSIKRIDMIDCSSLPNPFNEGFFRKYPYKQFFQIDLQCNEIPDWCSNKVAAPSICLTVPRHDKEYKFLGMALWFVSTGSFVVSVSHRERALMGWHISNYKPQGQISCVYYISYLDRPFDGQMIKGGEKITVHERGDIFSFKDRVKKIGRVKKLGIHLLYLDQHGNVTSLPGEVDHSYSPFPEERSARHEEQSLI